MISIFYYIAVLILAVVVLLSYRTGKSSDFLVISLIVISIILFALNLKEKRKKKREK